MSKYTEADAAAGKYIDGVNRDFPSLAEEDFLAGVAWAQANPTEEQKQLLWLARFMYITLGFYATEYNYGQESACTYPDGSRMLGILRDGGADAREASALAKKQPELLEKILSAFPPGDERWNWNKPRRTNDSKESNQNGQAV